MYVMFPQYEKVIDKTTEEAVFEQIEKNFRGINNEETLSNYKNFLDKFEELDNEVLSGDFISDYKNIENKEEKTLFLRNIRKELIKQIVNNIDSKQVKNVFKELEFKIIGLKYSTKGFAGEQNKLIEIYKSVLTNPEVYSDIMKSIDNDLIKNDINDLKPDISDSFMSVVNPRDDIEKRYSFLGGKAGVGMEANAMTDIWRDGRLFITNLFNFKWGNYDRELGQIELDLQYSEELSEKDLEYYVSEMIDSKASPERIEAFKNEIRKIKIGETLGTILNAFVDIVKEPYITNGNWTTSTTNVGNLMLRMGVHPLYVTAFLANPIIAKYNRFQQNNEGLFDNMSGDMFNKFKQSIVQEYVGDVEKGGKPKYSTLYALYFKDLNLSKKQLEDPVLVNKQQVTKNKVLKELNNDENEYNKFFDTSKKYFEDVFSPNKLDLFDRTTEQYNKAPLNLKTFRESVKNQENVDLNFQITLLNEFRNLQQSSKNLKFIVDFGKLDTNGIGKDPNTIFYLEDLLKTIIENEENTEDENGQLIKGVITNFNSKLNNTVLSKYYNNLLKIKYILLNNLSYFPMSNPVVRDIVSNIVNDVTKDYSKKEETYTKVANQFKTYIYNQLLDITNDDRKKVLENMPNYFLKFQQENTGKYFMIDNITVKNNRLELNNSEKSEEFQNLFTQSWEELFEDHPKFAESLVKYSFLTTGFNMTRTQFYSYIPFTYFIKVNVNKKLRNIFSNNNFEEFTNKFYLNHLGDRSIVKNVLKDNLSVDEQNEHVLFSENPKGLFIEVENKYYSLVGHSQTGYVYVQIKNEPQNNNYNVELQLYDFDESILATENEKDIDIEVQPIVQNNKVEIFKGFWTREQVSKQTDKIFLFGDNTNDRLNTKYIPSATQAVIRGLPNAIGIDTKKNRGTNEVKGINIKSDKTSPNSLGNRLTNPNWYAKDLFDVESNYKANASKVKAPHLNAEEALKYDMNLMYQLQLKKFRQNPELIDEVNAEGGLEFIKQSSHIVGVKNSRWEGKGMESNFIKVLAKSYETIAKELGKFVENNSSYFTDADFPQFKQQVDEAIQKAKDSGKTIVIPADGIGTGKAMLKERAPKLFEYLQQELNKLQSKVTETKQEVKSEVNNNIIFEEEQTTGYRNRTIKNASADATIAIAVDFNSAGEKLTKSSVLNQGKKYIPLDANNLTVTQERVDKIVNELNSVNAESLNIAGNGIYTMKGKYTQKQVDDFTYELLNKVINSPNLKTKIKSIRSGGQTGFDEAGTKAGIKLGLPTLTLAPKGWTFRNINGQDISNEQQFKARFGEFNKPQQLSLFDQLEQDKQLWEEIKDKWIESGRTEADFNSMSNEEKEHIIENCL